MADATGPDHEHVCPHPWHRIKCRLTSNLSRAGECELIDHKFKDGQVSPFSLPRCRNVYVLPGVPDLLQQKWRTLKVHTQPPLEFDVFHSLYAAVARHACDQA